MKRTSAQRYAREVAKYAEQYAGIPKPTPEDSSFLAAVLLRTVYEVFGTESPAAIAHALYSAADAKASPLILALLESEVTDPRVKRELRAVRQLRASQRRSGAVILQ